MCRLKTQFSIIFLYTLQIISRQKLRSMLHNTSQNGKKNLQIEQWLLLMEVIQNYMEKYVSLTKKACHWSRILNFSQVILISNLKFYACSCCCGQKHLYSAHCIEELGSSFVAEVVGWLFCLLCDELDSRKESTFK